MAQCAYCKAETFMYECEVPICIQCSEKRERVARKPPGSSTQIQNLLVNDIAEATARVSAANDEFYKVMSQVPSGLPHPDGAQTIHNASHELDIARKEMMKAHTRLNEYVHTGIVPADMKRSG
jgi:hypothetical protein